MSGHAERPLVDEVLATRVHGRRVLVHAREQRRDERGRVRLFLTGDPQALPHLGGMRIATRAGEHFELRDLRLVPPPAEAGEDPVPAHAALALAYPMGGGRPTACAEASVRAGPAPQPHRRAAGGPGAAP